MTRKHFIAIAHTIKLLPLSSREREAVAFRFADMCMMFNNNFDRERFQEACKPTQEL